MVPYSTTADLPCRDKEQRLPRSHHLLLGVAGAPAVRGSDAPAVRAGRARGANADAGIVEYGGRRLGWEVGGEERGMCFLSCWN